MNRADEIKDVVSALEILTSFCKKNTCNTCLLGIDSGKGFYNCGINYVSYKDILVEEVQKYMEKRKGEDK